MRADQRLIDEALSRADTRGSRSVKRLLPYILHWAALREALGANLPSGVEDPFEPLSCRSRGVGLPYRAREVDLEVKSVRMAGWRDRAEHPPLPTFAPNALDGIDRTGSIAQFGYVIDPL